MANISIDQLTEAIDETLTIYSNEITAGVKKVAQKKVKELVKRTKATAPVGKRKKHYKSNIASKKLSETSRSISYLWYVKGNDYRLSHLLENGHATRNGGRVEGTHFIKKATDPILEEYEREVKEVIENGG